MSDHHFMYRRTNSTHYSVRPIRYADDLQSIDSSLPGLENTANTVSVCAMVFNFTVAVHTL